MKIIGPLLDVENPNKFVFLRGFPSLEERIEIGNELACSTDMDDLLRCVVDRSGGLLRGSDPDYSCTRGGHISSLLSTVSPSCSPSPRG